jgi:hypothetical protein
MARGNKIIVSANPRGVFMEGVIGAGLTPYPGIVMQIQPATALVGGRHTFEIYNADADGGRPKGPIYILLEDSLQGLPATAAYAAGTRCFLYTPLPGEELNLMIGDVAGTADDHTKGEMLIIDDTTGEFVATTGSPETECAQLLESLTDPTADQLAWCIWTGF